jgi:hypothetical protein
MVSKVPNKWPSRVPFKGCNTQMLLIHAIQKHDAVLESFVSSKYYHQRQTSTRKSFPILSWPKMCTPRCDLHMGLVTPSIRLACEISVRRMGKLLCKGCGMNGVIRRYWVQMTYWVGRFHLHVRLGSTSEPITRVISPKDTARGPIPMRNF